MLDEFVCVRVVKANRLDLALFQFDFDLTFAIVMMNADGTVYGRFGTRSDQHDAERDITLDGLAAAMKGALSLHGKLATRRQSLAGKQPRRLAQKTPDDFPSLKGKYREKLDYKGQVVRSCMHCHQIGDAQREMFRSQGKPIPDQLLFPYPMPDVLGLKLDPKTRARIREVAPDSPAAQAGLQAGDELLWFDGQPILSIADVQWVLHHAGDRKELAASVRRGGQVTQRLAVPLPKGWRQQTDFAWRVSTWPLRRMTLGGLVLERLADDERADRKIKPGGMALRVKHVGQYGAHAAAKRAGFRKDDVVVMYDEHRDDWSESQLLAHGVRNIRPGKRIATEVLRAGKTVKLNLPAQK